METKMAARAARSEEGRSAIFKISAQQVLVDEPIPDRDLCDKAYDSLDLMDPQSRSRNDMWLE